MFRVILLSLFLFSCKDSVESREQDRRILAEGKMAAELWVDGLLRQDTAFLWKKVLQPAEYRQLLPKKDSLQNNVIAGLFGVSNRKHIRRWLSRVSEQQPQSFRVEVSGPVLYKEGFEEIHGVRILSSVGGKEREWAIFDTLVRINGKTFVWALLDTRGD